MTGAAGSSGETQIGRLGTSRPMEIRKIRSSVRTMEEFVSLGRYAPTGDFE